MVVRRCGFAAAMPILVALWSGLSITEMRADALSDLNKAFRDAYNLAVSQTLTDLRARVPVLVNRFGQIALYRPGVDQPDIFSMDMKVYLEARAIAHTVVALNARLAPFGLGPLDSERLDWLAKYETLLTNAASELTGRSNVTDSLNAAQLDMLVKVRGFVQRIYQRGEVDQTILDEMGAIVRPGIKKNLEAAAASQLVQFRTRIDQWKASYPALAWDRAVVVIIGIHQARENYLQRQFFDWLLHDQPSKQERVVFAETLQPPTIEKDGAADAMMLLSKVVLDKAISTSIFGDPLALQSDVLGGAAEDIIRGWPAP